MLDLTAYDPRFYPFKGAVRSIHEHPTTTKIIEATSFALGAGLLASLPFTASRPKIGRVVGAVTSGVALMLASSVAHLTLDLLIPPHHDMKNHVYQPGECDGGRLYYEGDVPILSLDSDTPFEAGKAHGYLCGEAIHRIFKRLDLILHNIKSEPRSEESPNTLAAIRETIPSEYLQEIEGLVEGYNQWAKEQYWWKFPKKITADDILYVHLIPDCSGLFGGGLRRYRDMELFGIEHPRQNVACSAIIDQDPNKGFVFARNMDWPSYGLLGTYSLIINRKHENHNGLHSTVEVGVPGFIGTITGMNDQGLSIAMNTNMMALSVYREVRGMPMMFYNRTCLERCSNLKAVEDFTHHHRPFESYHLTVADRDQAASIHFYQDLRRGKFKQHHSIRRWKKDHPLSTFNGEYSYTDKAPPPQINYHKEPRDDILDAFFARRKNEPLEDALALPEINDNNTIHRVIMEPETSTFRVAFDNALAGKAPLQSISTRKIFGVTTQA